MITAVLVGGIVLLAVILTDFFWTTLTLNGSGPLSGLIPRGLWWCLMRVANGTGNYELLSVAGPLVILGIFAFWFLGLWLGWTMVFFYEQAEFASEIEDPANWWRIAHYVGFTLSSLGVQSYETSNAFWRVLTAVAGVTGLTMLTLGITYLFSVISAVISGRAIAAALPNRDMKAEDILVAGWDGSDFKRLEAGLRLWTPQLFEYSQRRLAYPVIDYFWSSSEQTAIAPAVAQLDEVLLLLDHAVAEENRLPAVETDQAERAVSMVLNAVRWSQPQESVDEPPPAPDLDKLKEAGIPLIGREAFDNALEKRQDRRSRFFAWLKALGWDWRASGADEKNGQKEGRA